MKRLTVYLCLGLLNIFLIPPVFAQQILLGDKDYRIKKFERDIIQCSVKGENPDAKTPFNIQDFKLKIDVRKSLEVYSDTTNTQLLVIRFGISGDHTPRFWGILTNKERFFFYDPDDTGEPDLLIFKKKYDPVTVATILFYCYQFPPEDMGFVPKASWVYYQNMTIIKDALHYINRPTMGKVDSAVSFLESITAVKTESNKDDYGYHLTQEDYTKWLNWYKKNGKMLYWDKNEQKVKVR